MNDDNDNDDDAVDDDDAYADAEADDDIDDDIYNVNYNNNRLHNSINAKDNAIYHYDKITTIVITVLILMDITLISNSSWANKIKRTALICITCMRP